MPENVKKNLKRVLKTRGRRSWNLDMVNSNKVVDSSEGTSGSNQAKIVRPTEDDLTGQFMVEKSKSSF